jgi:hypothetical protein
MTHDLESSVPVDPIERGLDASQSVAESSYHDVIDRSTERAPPSQPARQLGRRRTGGKAGRGRHAEIRINDVRFEADVVVAVHV